MKARAVTFVFKKLCNRRVLFLWGALILVAVITLYLLDSHEPLQMLHDFLEHRVSPSLFLFLMLTLPVFGIPISIFLVLAGVKFGALYGLVCTALLMLLHMAATFHIANSFLDRWIIAILRSLNITMPPRSPEPNRVHAFLFVVFPGIPYALKNYLLSLSGLRFVPYMLINWTAQFVQAVPFVIAGEAVFQLDPVLLAVAAALVLCSFIVQRYVQRKFGAAGK